MDHQKGRCLHQVMCAAAVELQAISFNIAPRKTRHLHLAIPATDAGFQGILFSIAQLLVIPNLTTTKCLVLLYQLSLQILLMASSCLHLPQLHLQVLLMTCQQNSTADYVIR